MQATSHMLLTVAAFLLALVSPTAQSAFYSMDFESPALFGRYFLDGEFIYDNVVKLSASGENGAADILTPTAEYNDGPQNGGSYLHSSIYSSILLEHSSGSPFDLIGFDLGEYSAFASNPSVTVIGRKESGQEVSITLDIDALFDGLGGIDDFQRITLDASWTDLTRVSFDDSPYSLDNIVVNIAEVPLPSGWFLYASAIMCITGYRKVLSGGLRQR